MTVRITRREALRMGLGVAAGLALPAIGGGVASSFGAFNRTVLPRPFEQSLRIPSVLTPTATDANTDYYEVVQVAKSQEILPGLQTPIWGYNGTFPGPTIRARSGRRVVVRQTNTLPGPASVHLHGGVQPPESDGYPTDLIPSGGTKRYAYPNRHRAATLFYHDHAMDRTGLNVYMGLAGLYVIQDEIDDGLPLPKGDFDVPLVIQDRSFNPDGSFAYSNNDPSNVFSEVGNVILINGVPWPRFHVAPRRYRFRILNASGSTTYRLGLSSRQPLIQIATDGGLLYRPVSQQTITLAPAERAEVVIDFGGLSPGTTVELRNSLGSGDLARLMLFEVNGTARDDSRIPVLLDPTQPLTERMSLQTRTFVFKPVPVAAFPPFRFAINGELFDPSIVQARVPLGDVEIWTFENRTLGLGPVAAQEHPVHVHLVNFLILDRDGRPPAEYERGWKDTVLVGVNETVRVIARFAPFTGKYVIHCHNLAHEDHSMMANFEVV